MSKPIRAITDLNPKQLKFLEEYIRNGNLTKAYMLAFGLTNRASASVLASRLIKKTREVTLVLYETHGLGEDAVIKILKNAIKATKYKIYQGQKFEFPDHLVRLKAAELIHRFSGIEAEMDKGKIDNQVNVQIISDEKRGIFRVQDAQ